MVVAVTTGSRLVPVRGCVYGSIQISGRSLPSFKYKMRDGMNKAEWGNNALYVGFVI